MRSKIARWLSLNNVRTQRACYLRLHTSL